MLILDADLTLGSYCLILSAVALSYYVVSSVIAWRRLREFDGPLVATFSYVWIVCASGSGRMSRWFAAANARYGSGPSSTIRIGPNELLTSDPEVIRRTSAARSKYTRSDWYKLSSIDPYHECMLSTCDNAIHDRLKAQTAPGYAGKDNPTLEADIDAVMAQMVDKIRTRYAARAPWERSKMPLFDLATMAQYFTLDSISKVAFGQEFGMVREERDIYGHIDMLNEIALPVVVLSGVPYLRAIMGSKLVLALLGPKLTDKRGAGRIMRLVAPVHLHPLIADRALASLVTLSRSAGHRMRKSRTTCWSVNPSETQHRHAADRTLTSPCGHRGPSCATVSPSASARPKRSFRSSPAPTRPPPPSAQPCCTCSAPRSHTALCRPRSIRASAAATSRAPSQTPRPCSCRTCRYEPPIPCALKPNPAFRADDRNEKAVIYEGLRLHPPFTGLPFKVVPPQGDTIDGKHVPGGTLIAPNTWATGRHTGVFGADADVFRPERWLERGDDGDAKERVAEMRRVAELVFGYGRWGCAGKMLAFMELNKIFVEVSVRFAPDENDLANSSAPPASAPL